MWSKFDNVTPALYMFYTKNGLIHGIVALAKFIGSSPDVLK